MGKVNFLIFNYLTNNEMSKSITMIEGIGDVFKGKLADAGITSVEGLLEKGATKSGRKTIADASGISESKILDWVNMADLFRINGIASQFAELLKGAGVDTVKELRNRNADNLHAALVKTQDEKGLTRAVPALSKVEDFIAQAKSLDPIVTY
jgi:predicted flap endonuclease-1-like 5' DNA nuclease